MAVSWESGIADLLSELSSIQDEVLDLLTAKRKLLMVSDTAGLASLEPREQAAIARLQSFHDRRRDLLALAASEGLPASSVRSLTGSLPRTARLALSRQVEDAAARARILQHQSLTNWVVVQRTILHLSQLLEIIATGGRMQPTYGKGECARINGSLVDQAA